MIVSCFGFVCFVLALCSVLLGTYGAIGLIDQKRKTNHIDYLKQWERHARQLEIQLIRTEREKIRALKREIQGLKAEAKKAKKPTKSK